MDKLDIPQSDSSMAMMVMGGTEVITRIVVSFLGDHIKGYMLHMYIICCFMLIITNILGYFALTFLHFTIYVVGKLPSAILCISNDLLCCSFIFTFN